MPRPQLSLNPTPLMADQDGFLLLPMFGPARLEWRGQTIKLRRKSLAILYYLAVEGPTRRQLLADLLWEQVDSAQNLRVELHDLRKKLVDFGVNSFESSIDPLTLPPGLRLEMNSGDGESFEGLEGLSPAFQAWLEDQRALQDRRPAALRPHRELLASLVSRIRPPYLLILAAEPDSGQDAFVTALAARLGLGLTSELHGSQPALRHLSADGRYDDSVVRRIAEDRSNVWVVERPSFGEDSLFLLDLRRSYPASRTTFLELPGLSWRQVEVQLQASLTFPEAAEIYTRTGGHAGFLRELLELRGSNALADPAQLPQRIRAAYQLEARRLSRDARFALERASVHPGSMPAGLLGALDVEPYLIELERRNWLVLGDGWRFKGRVARQAIYLSLPKGRSQLYHGAAADYFEAAGNEVAAQYHMSRVNGSVDWSKVRRGLSGWRRVLVDRRLGAESGDQPTPSLTALGGETPLLESGLFGEQVGAQNGEAIIVRQPMEAAPSGAEWQLLAPSGVLQLRARAYVRNELDVGLGGDSPPLAVEFLGPRGRTVIFAAVDSPRRVDENTLLLPLAEEFESYLAFEDARFVRVSSSADAAVIELTLTAYEASGAKVGSSVLAF